MPDRPDELYGLVAAFDGADALLRAAEQMRAAGYHRLDGHSPFPVEGLAETLGFQERTLPFATLAGGLIGGVGGLVMQWYMNAYDYPINVGGRPLESWPAFAIPAFEMMVLGAVIAVIVGMLWMNGLPRLYHPLFNARAFNGVTRDRFLLSVERGDALFDREKTTRRLEELGAISVEEVPL